MNTTFEFDSNNTVNFVLESRFWVWVIVHIFAVIKKLHRKKMRIHCFANNLPLARPGSSSRLSGIPLTRADTFYEQPLKFIFTPYHQLIPPVSLFLQYLYFTFCFFAQYNATASQLVLDIFCEYIGG